MSSAYETRSMSMEPMLPMAVRDPSEDGGRFESAIMQITSPASEEYDDDDLPSGAGTAMRGVDVLASRNRGATYRLGLLLVTGSAFAWSLAGFFTRLIHLDVWTMLAWRGLFGAVGIAAVALSIEGKPALKALRRLGRPGWCYAVLSGGGMVLFITALRHTTVAHVAVIYATAPFFAALLAWWTLREAPSWAALAASGAALSGVAMMWPCVVSAAENRSKWPAATA